MKKQFFLAALASVALVGCVNDLTNMEDLKGEEINFAVAKYSPQSRAEDEPEEHDKGDDFTGDVKIWSWYYGADDVVIDGNGNAAGEGDVYQYSSSSEKWAFESGNTYYWPANGQALDFVAVPIDVITKGYFSAPTRSDGSTALTFSISADKNYHSTNIMTTQVIQNQTSGTTGTVALLFRHLLAQLKIKVEQTKFSDDDGNFWAVTLNSLTLSNLADAGTVTIDNNWKATDELATGTGLLWNAPTSYADTWEVVRDSDDDDDDPDAYTFTNTVNGNSYTSDAPYYILPQALEEGEDKQKMTINYSITTTYSNGVQPPTTETYSKTFKLKGISGGNSTTIDAWYMNKIITYNISIDPSETLTPIKFKVNKEVWGTQTETPSDITPGNSTKVQ